MEKRGVASFNPILVSSRGRTCSCNNPTCKKPLQETGRLVCSACESAVYCNKECQIADWKEHKAPCKEFSLHPNKTGILGVRQIMNSTLYSARDVIRFVQVQHQAIPGGVFFDLDKMNGQIDLEFIEFTNLKCTLDLLAPLMKAHTDGAFVFGVLFKGKVLMTTIYN